MLVLSRDEGQAILIGEQIRVSIVDIARGRVKVGVDAPSDTPIRRQELAAADVPKRRASTRAELVAALSALIDAADRIGVVTASRVTADAWNKAVADARAVLEGAK